MNFQENNVSDSKSQVDDALKFLRNHSETVSMTSTEEKALVRKLDWMLMPLMAVVYNLQYLDKTIRISPYPASRWRHNLRVSPVSELRKCYGHLEGYAYQ